LGETPLYLEVTDPWPNQPMVSLNLGIVLGRLHCLGEASQCLQRALSLGFDKPRAHYQLGQNQEYFRQQNAAAQSLLTATGLNPGFLDACIAWPISPCNVER